MERISMTEPATPAMAAYQQISPLRDKHAAVIWGDNRGWVFSRSPGSLGFGRRLPNQRLYRQSGLGRIQGTR
jgi:hypothetical protein